MIQFAIAYRDILANHTLYATGTTGLRVKEATGLPIHRFQSGPLGGDQQIGALIADNAMDLVLFLETRLPRSRMNQMYLHSFGFAMCIPFHLPPIWGPLKF